MNIRTLVVIATMAALIFSRSVIAAEANIKNLVEMSFATTNVSIEQRMKAATEILSVCSNLNAKLPSLSPSEKEWVDEEVNSGRVESLISTIEGSKLRLKNVATQCINAAKRLTEKNETDTHADNWIDLALVFIGRYPLDGDIQRVKKVLKIELTETEKLVLTSGSSLVARGALNGAKSSLSNK